MNSKYWDHFLEVPICIMPGGSMNATACDLNGKVENWAATNVLRGDYVDKEILCIKDLENGSQIYSNSFAYGLYSDLIEIGDRTFAWCCWK